ncbi:nucleoside-diphosphate kinase [Candidatus Curtissbacteria bacterium RIFCSPHIGHO2_12_FULL_41_17]|uniref:Nucleoside diphosphate kinase n=2 Tax=Candidatus Curtissiibacteriota TaxID=1752717 RepID=A0A1F5HJ07_9BACT|nr:MAG: nucleoside-diphosphate kinase [Candidatus Curtissbacteria bacterium RIFCSPHIGHO2_01_FULL_40_12]OGE04117.1 MAG: nucleoside-diphosphate kinase [Candidatus Curtissbacteria bacterium RIFCSPHIGHO2_12_FULL_41_17]
MQRTVVLLKPDALQRGLVGEIIHRFERKGLKLVGLKMLKVSETLLEEHYAHHKDKPFFKSLKKFMSSSPIVCMLWEGLDAVKVARRIAGATSGREAELGSIRGDFSMSTSANIIHVSDSIDAAKEEEDRFFDRDEIFDWERVVAPYLYGEDEK